MNATEQRTELAAGFLDFYAPLHARFAREQRRLVQARGERLARAHAGAPPAYLPPSDATTREWSIDLPAWCRDQRNQMTGPADDADLVGKLLDSGAPGVMLDLEDSIVDQWDHVMRGHENILGALYRAPTHRTVIWSRVRGLHLEQLGILAQTTSAALFDVAYLCYRVEYERLHHPLCIYIPKSESAEEGRWWAQVFDAVIAARGWHKGAIKAMALVESHPLAYEIEEFLYELREYALGLNLGRWDYMASLVDFNVTDPRWLLPDRNTIPTDVPFFQRVRLLLPEICHKHGALAIGGMTALYPNRADAALNARALDVLERDKRNEASCFMDGAWTGHPDQNAIAVAQFPEPNQLQRRPHLADVHPDLRPAPIGVGTTTLEGTRAAVRTVIRYRNGVLEGRGASLLDGYMEDLATDRIYRLMIAQRMLHRGPATPPSLCTLFDEELDRIVSELPDATAAQARYRQARRISEEMVRSYLRGLGRVEHEAT